MKVNRLTWCVSMFFKPLGLIMKHDKWEQLVFVMGVRNHADFSHATAPPVSVGNTVFFLLLKIGGSHYWDQTLRNTGECLFFNDCFSSLQHLSAAKITSDSPYHHHFKGWGGLYVTPAVVLIGLVLSVKTSTSQVCPCYSLWTTVHSGLTDSQAKCFDHLVVDWPQVLTSHLHMVILTLTSTWLPLNLG